MIKMLSISGYLDYKRLQEEITEFRKGKRNREFRRIPVALFNNEDSENRLGNKEIL
jgi:hypothetical protein